MVRNLIETAAEITSLAIFGSSRGSLGSRSSPRWLDPASPQANGPAAPFPSIRSGEACAPHAKL